MWQASAEYKIQSKFIVKKIKLCISGLTTPEESFIYCKVQISNKHKRQFQIKCARKSGSRQLYNPIELRVRYTLF